LFRIHRTGLLFVIVIAVVPKWHFPFSFSRIILSGKKEKQNSHTLQKGNNSAKKKPPKLSYIIGVIGALPQGLQGI
tara:strand:+ start:3838 stop:4065 length:228 start_codon:yes stop_codon:yes gene_type:complete